MIVHAGLVAVRGRAWPGGGAWRAALIEGPSGVGKSDLALRTTAAGFHLVADDRTVVFASAGRLFGRAPDNLAGLIEVRGLGPVRQPALPMAQIVLVVRCLEAPEAVERLPPLRESRLAGVAVPRLDLWPREPSAPAKLRLALEDLGRSV